MKNLMKQITKNGRIFWVTYFTFFLILAMPTHAGAYVDPATLTYVVQIIAGVGSEVADEIAGKIKETADCKVTVSQNRRIQSTGIIGIYFCGE